MGLAKRNEPRGRSLGKLSDEYDLSGLVARLAGIQPEIRECEEAARAKRREVQRPGLRRRMKAAEGP